MLPFCSSEGNKTSILASLNEQVCKYIIIICTYVCFVCASMTARVHGGESIQLILKLCMCKALGKYDQWEFVAYNFYNPNPQSLYALWTYKITLQITECDWACKNQPSKCKNCRFFRFCSIITLQLFILPQRNLNHSFRI